MVWANGFCQNFFPQAALVSTGENIIFRYNNGYKQRLSPLVTKWRQFSDLFSWDGVLTVNEAEKEKNNEKGNSASALSQFASLSECKMQFWQKDTLVKPNKLQTGLFHPSRVSLSFSVFKFFKYETEALKRKIEIKPIPILFILLNIYRIPRTNTSDIVVRFLRRILWAIPPAML